HLKAAAVGGEWSLPIHEFMQTAELGDQLRAGAQGEMIRVADEQLRVEVVQVFGSESFDGCLSCDRHERGRFDVAVRGMDYADAAAISRITVMDVKREWRQAISFNGD